MATMNRSAMVTLVLQKLQVIAAGETARALDITLVGDRYDAALDFLGTRGRIGIDPNSVTPESQEQLATYVAARCAPYFGVGTQRNAELQAGARTAERELLQLRAMPREESAQPTKRRRFY